MPISELCFILEFSSFVLYILIHFLIIPLSCTFFFIVTFFIPFYYNVSVVDFKLFISHWKDYVFSTAIHFDTIVVITFNIFQLNKFILTTLWRVIWYPNSLLAFLFSIVWTTLLSTVYILCFSKCGWINYFMWYF